MLFILITLGFVIAVISAMIAIHFLMVSRRPDDITVAETDKDSPSEE